MVAKSIGYPDLKRFNHVTMLGADLDHGRVVVD